MAAFQSQEGVDGPARKAEPWPSGLAGHIAYMADRDFNDGEHQEVWVMDLADGETIKLTHNHGGNLGEATNTSVFLQDGSRLELPTQMASRPSWSADGGKVAFASTGESGDIWVVETPMPRSRAGAPRGELGLTNAGKLMSSKSLHEILLDELQGGHDHGDRGWIMWVALTAIILALFSSVGVLLAGITSTSLMERTEEILELSKLEGDRLHIGVLRSKHDV